MNVCIRILRSRLPNTTTFLNRRSHATATTATEANTTATQDETTSDEPTEDGYPAGEVLEEFSDDLRFSDDPAVFHTRSLEVHEAFRRFRPPRESWMYSFIDHTKRGLVELHPVIFAANPRIDLIHDTMKWQNECIREDDIQYMRSELPGSGRKMRPQKGTGMARMKDKRAPQFKFGGTPLGRRPRDFGYDLDINVLTAAFCGICTAKHSQGDLYVVDSLETFTIPGLVNFKKYINAESVLFVTGYNPGLSQSQNTEICFHPGIDLLTSELVHPKAILEHMVLVLDYAALTQLEEWVLTVGQEHKLEGELQYHDNIGSHSLGS